MIQIRSETLALMAAVLVGAGTTSAGGAEAVPVREVRFLADGGVTVHADLHLRHDPAAPLILLFHQAGGDARGEYGPIVPRLLDAGYNVLAVDQRTGGDRFGGVNRTVRALDDQLFDYCSAYPDLEAALAWVVAERLGGRRAVWGSSYSAALVFQLGARHSDEVDAVLAFSPASGDPMKGCEPEPFAERLGIPALALRPASEMANERARSQLEQLASFGVRTYVADPGRHGSSMLVAERVGGDVEPAWREVLAFLSEALTAAPD